MEEEPQEMEDFTYHRPVLAAEAVELLAPHPGSLVVDGTVGGGGHTEAILKTGADILATRSGPGRNRRKPASNSRHLRRPRHLASGQFSRRRQKFSTNSESKNRRRASRSWRFVAPTGKRRARFQHDAQRPARHANGSADRESLPRTSSTITAKKNSLVSFAISAKSRPRDGIASLIVKMREERAVLPKRSNSRAPSKKWWAVTDAGIRPPRFFRHCEWK